MQEAGFWWAANRSLVPGLLAAEIRDAVAVIVEQPRIWPRVLGTNRPEVRRYHLRRVHYFLYYSFQPGTIEIPAFWHTARGSAPDL